MPHGQFTVIPTVLYDAALKPGLMTTFSLLFPGQTTTASADPMLTGPNPNRHSIPE